MPYSNTFQLPRRTWVLLTPEGPVAAGRIQQQSAPLHLRVTPTNVAPADTNGSIIMAGFDGPGFLPSETFGDLFPGTLAPGATGYLWAYSETGSIVSVSYA